MYLQIVISNNQEKKIFFVGVLKFTDKSEARSGSISQRYGSTYGSGSVLKCHGSGTLYTTYATYCTVGFYGQF